MVIGMLFIISVEYRYLMHLESAKTIRSLATCRVAAKKFENLRFVQHGDSQWMWFLHAFARPWGMV